MSHSPGSVEQEQDAYLLGWQALSRHLRRGFSWSGHERDTAFAGLGDGSFVDVSAISGLDVVDDGRTAVVLDLDLDGDLDVLRVGRGAPRLRCLLNRGEPHRGFVGLRLVGQGSMVDAIGARVTLICEGAPEQHFVRRAGGGFLCQAGPWTLLASALGQSARASVLWPDGKREEFSGLRSGRRYILRQGTGEAQRFVPPSLSSQWALGPVEPAHEPARRGRLVAAAPLPVPSLLIRDQDGLRRRILGTRREVAAPSDQPTLLHVFSVDCAVCVAALPGLAQRAREWSSNGVAVIALSSDPASEQLRARGLLDRSGWPGARGRIPEQSLRILDALGGYLSDSDLPMVSPSTYLFDGSGRLVALYQGRVDERQIQADLGLAAPWDPVRRQNFAGLRPGRWIMPPFEELGIGFARVLKRRGLPDSAQELEALAIKVRDFDMPGYLVELAMARWQQGQREQAVASMRQALALEGAARSNERRVQWLRSLASMETLMGHDGQALELWQQLIGIKPQDYAAWVGQGVILHRMGREADYTALLEELESKAPQFATQLKSLVKDEAP
ncbi:MAG TPA: hypothetical protein EYQ25_10435 [Planctomycetes bacterium]|nr:hypothetical protein [Planctomycetota bacterium]HIL38184.1 hypothetical protein [Planctomycetota bacterium]